MAHGCCDDFTRSSFLRRAAQARPGSGLPDVERGMPLPAGTGLDRRAFLLRSAGLALSIYGGAALAPRAFEEGIAAARAAVVDDPILVTVFLSGGVDSLSLLAPTGGAHAARYQQLRPTLALARNDAHAFAEDPSLQWHPSALGLRDLHAEGKLSVLPGVGYDDPNQSHFTSRHYWEVGALDPFGRFGWLGRYIDRYGSDDNPLQGLSLDWSLSPVVAAATKPVAAVGYPQGFDLWMRNVWDGGVEGPIPALLGKLGALATDDPELATARRVASQTSRLVDQLAPLQGATISAGSYPAGNDFGERLAALAAMIDAPYSLPLKVVSLQASGGYDTHDGQARTFADDLGGAVQSLHAFQRDLEQRGLADRVITLVWSEFGRRPEQNATGTDHGAGGCAFVMGNHAAGTMVGEFPGLATLDRHHNLRHTTDFRDVYRGLLDQWLGADPDAIVTGRSGPVPTLIS